MSEYQVVNHKLKHYSPLTQITINDNTIYVCKKWINNMCHDNCLNYHHNIKICQFYMKGICNRYKCFNLHPIELQPKNININYQIPKQIISNIPFRGCIYITVNNEKISVCERWVESCKLPLIRRNELSCYGIHDNNHLYKKHLRIFICEYYLKGTCRNNENCNYLHPIELLPNIKIHEAQSSNELYPTQKYIRPFTKSALCASFMLNKY